MMLLLLANILSGMESQSLRVFVIPGQNNLGLQNDYVSRNTGIAHDKIYRVDTPTAYFSVDLGQSGCMKKLEHALDKEEDDYLVYANSQGTATAGTWLAQNSRAAHRCRALVLESVMASGNDTICNTMIHRIPWLKKVPGLYYFLPYLAKLPFPSYSPAGAQAIKSAKDLFIDGPVIIVHSELDPETPYEGARALYHALRKRRRDVYLIPETKEGHINLMNISNDNPVRTILAYHRLVPGAPQVAKSKISPFQPDPAGHKAAHDELITKEQRHTWVSRGLWTASFASVCVLAKWLINRKA